MTNSLQGPLSDPSMDSWNAAEQQWVDMNSQQTDDQNLVNTMIAQMDQMRRSGADKFMILMFAQMSILPTVMGSVQDKTGVYGATENIASSLRNIVTGIQNVFNEGKNILASDVAHMMTKINDLYAILGAEKTKGKDSPLAGDTIDSLTTSLDAITKGINGVAGPIPAGTDPAKIAKTIQALFQPGTGTDPQVNPALQAITSAFQSASTTLSTMSATQTSQEQFYNNLLNQVQGVVSQMYKDANTLDNLLVSNEKTQ